MIALDTNILIDLLVKSQKDHSVVFEWFEKNRDSLAMTHTNIAEALRLLTHPRVFPSPLRLNRAVDLLQDFIESFDVRILEEDGDWWLQLKDLVREINALRGNEIFDARIALTLRFNGIKDIVTRDADFEKYHFLNVVRPD